MNRSPVLCRMGILLLLIIGLCVCPAHALQAVEYHVAKTGSDANPGTQSQPFATISAAAAAAQPGDVITVHEGVYRERINPPRGGSSAEKPIVYQAAKGETVCVRGSEVVTGWKKVGNDTWKVTLPDTFFGQFNPFKQLITGDWFSPKGRVHHLGAVYLNGHWLTEAATLDEVLAPAGESPLWYTPAPTAASDLLNVAWFQPQKASDRVPADGFSAQQGTKTMVCGEGGQSIGWIDDGDWVRYDNVDCGAGSEQIEFRASSQTGGGTIEVRLDKPDGPLLGACAVEDTGNQQRWKTFTAKIQPTEGRKTICLVFRSGRKDAAPVEVQDGATTIWAQFKGVDPNQGNVEINVREAVFYPEKTGVNFITVRGLTLEHAAPNWAPPTAEQVGLIGTHWSKGWIIEQNTIRYSICTGVSLGKYGDDWDNRAQSAEGYVGTINRGLANGWSKENIGRHVVRNNHISHCEQAGIVGSLGPIFCTITDNTIHDIHVRRLFGGAEMAGIKFHGAIDTLISRNHIYRCCRGIWLDWMAQGTHVTRNLLHDNGPSEDLFVEVNHGPFLVDNNVMLSGIGILVNSQGGAYAHNLVAGEIRVIHTERRMTPHQKPHSTEMAGLLPNPSGDDRYYNNIFLNAGLPAYDKATLPVFMAGNVFLKGAKPCNHESDPLVWPEFDPGVELVEQGGAVDLRMAVDPSWQDVRRQLVTTEMLGKASGPDLPYEQPDGSPYRIDTDYFGEKRSASNPAPGPFRLTSEKEIRRRVWPQDQR
ncbi:MAG: carbohydrate-binding protein [Planctomycetaceae bacterium]|nr:carbohydrate-binding protein [Planctomycetaceae bacterium]